MQPFIDEFWAPMPPTVLPLATPLPVDDAARGHVSEGESVPGSNLRGATDTETAATDPVRVWRDNAPPLRGEDVPLDDAESRVSTPPRNDAGGDGENSGEEDLGHRRSDRLAGREPSFQGPLPPVRRARQTTSAENYMDHDLALSAVRPPIPETYNEAVSHPESDLWWKAMDKEYQAFVETGTFTVVPRPKQHSVVKCRWVYDEKLDAFGNLQRRKARLVAKGYTQIQGVDYE